MENLLTVILLLNTASLFFIVWGICLIRKDIEEIKDKQL